MEWVIPCNEKLYNHRDAFNNLDHIDWRQSTNVRAGDVVYIYVGRPTSSILYKCYVKETDITVPDNNDVDYSLTEDYLGPAGRYMRLVLICKYPKGLFAKDIILQNGLKTVQGPSKMTDELRNYILAHETDNVYSTTDQLKGFGSLRASFRRKDGDIESHECKLNFSILNHHMWPEVVDSISFELAKAAKKKLDEYNNPEDFLKGYIYYKEKGDPALGLDIERIDNEWVFSRSKTVSCIETTKFYADGRKEVELVKR